MRVAHLLTPARFGGLETVVTSLAETQVSIGDEVSAVVVLAEASSEGHPVPASLREAGVAVEEITVPGRAYLSERRLVREALTRIGPDIAHSHGYRSDVLHAAVARKLGLPTVSTAHGFSGGPWRNRCYEWLQVRAFRRFDGVVAVSTGLETRLVSAGVSPDRVHVVRNALRAVPAALTRDDARRRLGLSEPNPRVAWIGRLSPAKAPDLFVRAIQHVTHGEARFSVLGSGGLDSECRTLAQTLGVDDVITWHGSVQGAATLLSAFDVVVMTSRTEGTPMLLLEAMSAGVPVVATAVGGIPDVVSPKEAHLCETGDVRAIARAIDCVLSSPEDARTRARAALRRVQRDFAPGPWAQRHRDLYLSLLPGRS